MQPEKSINTMAQKTGNVAVPKWETEKKRLLYRITATLLFLLFINKN
jgi:hypothetical protein